MKLFFLLLFVISGLVQATYAQTSLDNLFESYWESRDTREKERAAKAIVAVNPDFQEVYRRLASGRNYSSKVKSGFFSMLQVGAEVLPPGALVFVPYDYSPAKKYPVRVLLHGAVMSTSPYFVYQFVDTTNVAYKTSQVIQIYPAGWALAPWWSEAQFKNIHNLVNDLKDLYNVDEQNVRLAGISDGATGSFYLTNADITPWSCITPFIGSLETLRSLKGKQTYLNNLSNKPFFIVNAGRDEIFKKEIQQPYFASFKLVNPGSRVMMVDSSRHSMGWYPVLRDTINQFADKHRRRPYPDTLTWQTNFDDKFNRCHYIVINQLGKTKSSSPIDDHNLVSVRGHEVNAYDRELASGTLQVTRSGNILYAKSSYVKKFTILLSPDHFDFSKPVTVFINGVKQLEAAVVPDVKTLLKWNSIDNDRTMLFGAEMTISVK